MCLLCYPCKKVCGKDDCEHCFSNSFASCDKNTPNGKPVLECWSLKNGLVKPLELLKGSNKKYWFDCDNCGHDFDCSLANITHGRWCSYCTNGCRKVCGNEDCEKCFENSFASSKQLTRLGNKVVDYWSVNNKDIKPIDISITPRWGI